MKAFCRSPLALQRNCVCVCSPGGGPGSADLFLEGACLTYLRHYVRTRLDWEGLVQVFDQNTASGSFF